MRSGLSGAVVEDKELATSGHREILVIETCCILIMVVVIQHYVFFDIHKIVH